MQPLAQPPRKDDRSFDDWMYRLWRRIASTAGLAWELVDKTGSNLTDLTTRNHNDLQNIAGGATNDYSHLTAAQVTDLTGGNLGTIASIHNHDHLYLYATNKTGVTITAGQVVYINGAQGSRPTLALAKADAEATSAGTIGIVSADILNNASGNVVVVGRLEGLNTSAFVNGDIIYLSPTVAGGITTTRPVAPNQFIPLGIIVNAHITQGAINVNINNGNEIAELHDVQITTPSNNDLLMYDSTALVWKNAGVWRRIAQIVTTQVGAVATGTTTIPADNTIPQNTEGDQYMSLSITPTNVNSTLEIDVLWIGSNSAAAGNVLTTALFQDTTANALGANFLSLAGAALPDSLAIKYIMTAGTTSATTFKVRAGCSAAGTTTFNGASGSQFLGGVLESRITIKEYLP